MKQAALFCKKEPKNCCAWASGHFQRRGPKDKKLFGGFL
jgi:hypothetical protein